MVLHILDNLQLNYSVIMISVNLINKCMYKSKFPASYLAMYFYNGVMKLI